MDKGVPLPGHAPLSHPPPPHESLSLASFQESNSLLRHGNVTALTWPLKCWFQQIVDLVYTHTPHSCTLTHIHTNIHIRSMRKFLWEQEDEQEE